MTLDKSQEMFVDSYVDELTDYFINEEREYNGEAITKENVTDLFDSWVQTMDFEVLKQIVRDYV